MPQVLARLDRDILEYGSWWPSWLRWRSTSNDLHEIAEAKLLNSMSLSFYPEGLKSRLESFFTPIFDETLSIRTLIARNFPHFISKTSNNPEDACPIVLIHGFASGCALWCKNIDHIAMYRRTYFFDVLGFGRSSRPDFPTDASSAEAKFVQSIEDWRISNQLDKFILLGHSMGGFLASSYALLYPRRVAHLILVDPWGFTDPPSGEKISPISSLKTRMLLRTAHYLFKPFNPLALLRAAGPFGPSLIRRFRPDLRIIYGQPPSIGSEIVVPPPDYDIQDSQSFSDDHIMGSSHFYKDLVPSEDSKPGLYSSPPISINGFGEEVFDYIYHSNARKPSGEIGFKGMCAVAGWAAIPMLPRFANLDPNLPVTFIYGSRSWVDSASGEKAKLLRPNTYVDVKILEGAGHHAYAQLASEFNAYVNAICLRFDNHDPFIPYSDDRTSELAFDMLHDTMDPTVKCANVCADCLGAGNQDDCDESF